MLQRQLVRTVYSFQNGIRDRVRAATIEQKPLVLYVEGLADRSQVNSSANLLA